MKENKKHIKIGNIFIWLQLILTVVFVIVLFQMKMVPVKIIGIAGVVLFVIWLILRLIKTKTKKKKVPQVIISVISLILCIILAVTSVVGLTFYKNTVRALDRNTQINYETNAISVIVMVDSGYDTLDDLDGKTMGVNPNQDQDNIANAISELKESVDVEYVEADDFEELSDMLYDGQVDAILVNEAYRAMLEVNHENFDYETKVIHQCEYKTEKDTASDSLKETNIQNGIFTVYISGIDTYGKVSTKSRSDVNMLLTVNTNTREIVMVSIPRDYYVTLGTIGQKDKLTHAGIYGIDESVATLSKLYDTDINYYYRINFSSLINIVDVLGGIDVYSEKTFVPWGDNELTIHKGMNHMDGRMALAYARERKTYASGDNHRVANQQDVLEAIIGKVFSLDTLMNYDSFLEALDGTFETNMSTDEIMAFMKMLLNDASHLNDWHIERVYATGSNSRNTTYSMPNRSLYVMEPDADSVSEITDLLHRVQSGESIRED